MGGDKSLLLQVGIHQLEAVIIFAHSTLLEVFINIYSQKHNFFVTYGCHLISYVSLAV